MRFIPGALLLFSLKIRQIFLIQSLLAGRLVFVFFAKLQVKRGKS